MIYHAFNIQRSRARNLPDAKNVLLNINIFAKEKLDRMTVLAVAWVLIDKPHYTL